MSSRSERTRAAILDAAWVRLEAGGAGHLEDIAADAGVSRQSVYLHFESRAGLLLALVEHVDRQLGLYVEIERVMAIQDPVEQLTAVLDLTAIFEPKVHGLAMTLHHEAAGDPAIAAAYEDRMQHRRGGLHATLSAIHAQGRLRDEWEVSEVVDVLWEAQSPTTYDHLVVERGWSTQRWMMWVHTLASWFVLPPSES